MAGRLQLAIPFLVAYCTVQYNMFAIIIANIRRSDGIRTLDRPFQHLGDGTIVGMEITMSATSVSASQSTISVVHPNELSVETQQTSGSLRKSAITAMHGIASSMWAGIFEVDPLGKTGIHHHGEQDTVVYVLDGEAFVRWGDSGEHSTMVRAGDFLHMPSWLPHQESNPSEEHPFRWVVVRSTPEPIVVNLPDDFWADHHGEE